jgi:hypothetical protein
MYSIPPHYLLSAPCMYISWVALMTASVSPGGCLDPVNVVISIGMLQVRKYIIISCLSCLYNMWLDLYLFILDALD